METCKDCGEKTTCLYPDDDPKVDERPHYCEHCAVLWSGDKKIVEAEGAIQEELGRVCDIALTASDDLFANPEQKIRDYFQKVFNWAFSVGFVRSYLHVRHYAKDGRLRRIRDLWTKGNVDHYRGTFGGLTFDEFRELERLILWTKTK